MRPGRRNRSFFRCVSDLTALREFSFPLTLLCRESAIVETLFVRDPRFGDAVGASVRFPVREKAVALLSTYLCKKSGKLPKSFKKISAPLFISIIIIAFPLSANSQLYCGTPRMPIRNFRRAFDLVRPESRHAAPSHSSMQKTG